MLIWNSGHFFISIVSILSMCAIHLFLFDCSIATDSGELLWFIAILYQLVLLAHYYTKSIQNNGVTIELCARFGGVQWRFEWKYKMSRAAVIRCDSKPCTIQPKLKWWRNVANNKIKWVGWLVVDRFEMNVAYKLSISLFRRICFHFNDVRILVLFFDFFLRCGSCHLFITFRKLW